MQTEEDLSEVQDLCLKNWQLFGQNFEPPS